MPADLEQLLMDASGDPPAAPDADALWAAGRRRRRYRTIGAVASGVVALIGAGAVSVALLTAGSAPVIEPVGETDPPPADEPADPPIDDPEPTDPAPGDDPDAQPAAPEPDAAAMEDPCAAHEGQEDGLVIDVVSPVDGQHVTGEIELVGCARVFEATVRYRLRGHDGEPIVDTFTTATAGGPAIGEFRETIEVTATGVLTLEVFWDDPATGSEAADDPERDLVTVEIVAE